MLNITCDYVDKRLAPVTKAALFVSVSDVPIQLALQDVSKVGQVVPLTCAL